MRAAHGPLLLSSDKRVDCIDKHVDAHGFTQKVEVFIFAEGRRLRTTEHQEGDVREPAI